MRYRALSLYREWKEARPLLVFRSAADPVHRLYLDHLPAPGAARMQRFCIRTREGSASLVIDLPRRARAKGSAMANSCFRHILKRTAADTTQERGVRHDGLHVEKGGFLKWGTI